MRRLAAVGVLVLSVTLVLAGCGDRNGATTTDRPAATAASGGEPADPDVAEMPPEERAAVEVCRQVITSAGVMVRDYNAFMRRLNQTQDYAQIGDEDQWAVETLVSGAGLIRDKMTDVPSELAATLDGFLVATGLLAEQIERQSKQALNRVSQDWGERRTDALEACSAYLPALA